MAIIQTQGGGLEPLIQVLLTEKRLAAEKEDLKIRQGDFKLRSEQAAREQELQNAAIQGAQAAAAVLMRSRPEIASAAEGLEGAALPSFLESLQGFEQAGATLGATEAGTRATTATARGAESSARVSEATEEPQIEVARMAPALTRADLSETEARTVGLLANVDQIKSVTRGQELSNTYAAMQNQLGAEFTPRISQARALFETGQVTWQQARETLGLPEGGIPDDTVFVPAGGTQANAEAMKNQSFAQMMQTSNGIINQLEGSGVRLSLLSSLQRQTQFASFDALLNAVAGTDQERLVNAQRMFGDAYRFSLSGQQSSDREALRMLNSVSSQFADSEETISQKRVLREVMTNVTRMKAGGGITSVQGAQMGLRAARNTGDAETIELFQEILDQAIAQEGDSGISNAPTDASNFGPRLERADSLIDLGLIGRFPGR
jgi:hypothetical protein